MKTLHQWTIALWAVLKPLGAWGIFAIAGMDGAGVPLPGAVDAVLATYVLSNPLKGWAYVLAASVGSALGCLVLYGIGYAGGEMLIQKRMAPWKYDKIRRDFENHRFLTLALPAILPPPFPFKIFVLSAGAFEMHWTHFLAAILLGRLVRFGALALLTIRFGPGMVTLFGVMVRQHLLMTLAVVAAAAVLLLVWRRRGRGAAVIAAE